MHPLERLVNLVALLLESRRPRTFDEIRRLLPAYEQDDINTAKRMFERDKDLLRDIGVPIETTPTDAWEVEEGYVIPKDRYYLPEISFTAEETSALLVTARSAGEDPSAEQAIRKLLSGSEGAALPEVTLGPLAADPGDGARLTALADAVDRSRSVRFRYRTARGAASERHADPYGLVWRGGHWYVVGMDRERGEIRAFRLSRISSDIGDAGEGAEPPKGFRAADHVQAGPWGPGEAVGHAVLALAPEVAWWATAGVPGAERVRTRRDGWVEVRVPTGAGDTLASWVLQFGPEAKVVSPRSLRDEVVRRLEASLAG